MRLLCYDPSLEKQNQLKCLHCQRRFKFVGSHEAKLLMCRRNTWKSTCVTSASVLSSKRFLSPVAVRVYVEREHDRELIDADEDLSDL